MEDVFTIRVKSTPSSRNVFPSERRYSASTVAGLAWVHGALAATCFVLACLAVARGGAGSAVARLAREEAVARQQLIANVTSDYENTTAQETPPQNKVNSTENMSQADAYSCILIVAPSVLTVASLAAGIASVMASSRWYVDRNIAWLFVVSLLSSAAALVAFVAVVAWLASGEGTLSTFHVEKEPFDDYIIIPKDSIVDRNSSHFIIAGRDPAPTREYMITKSVLSINILIACFLEFVWSVLSVKISHKGMKASYKDDENQREGSRVQVVTTVKGNKNLRAKPTPDLIKHYPANAITQALNENNCVADDKIQQESRSEYRNRMMSFINRCEPYEESNPDTAASGRSVSTVPEIKIEHVDKSSRVSTISWGDSRDQTVYNQNNLDLGRILTEKIKTSYGDQEERETKETESGEAETSENVVRS